MTTQETILSKPLRRWLRLSPIICMMNKYLTLFFCIILYILSYISSQNGLTLLPALSLVFIAILLYRLEKRSTGEILNLRGLLALGLFGGEGIACLKLSNLSTNWSDTTWFSFFCFYFCFYAMHELIGYVRKAPAKITMSPFIADIKTSQPQTAASSNVSKQRFFQYTISALLIITWVAFTAEACVLGFIPLFTHNMPHAYSYFHVHGVHYFTTLSVLIPALTLLYLFEKYPSLQSRDLLCLLKKEPIAALGFVLPVLLTILLVSRSQFLFTVLLALFTLILSGRNFRIWQYLLLGASLIIVYSLITVARAHSVQYLNGIFDMKNRNMPIFITQPYMYIANNYDNFNLMTQNLSMHSYGLKMFYPLFTLSGLKFFIPALNAQFPAFVTKTELTTVTLLYDAWYDFGMAGIIILAAFLGAISAFITQKHAENKNPLIRLLYAQVAFYFIFSFFTIWFSLTSTWFYMLISLGLYVAFALIERRVYR